MLKIGQDVMLRKNIPFQHSYYEKIFTRLYSRVGRVVGTHPVPEIYAIRFESPTENFYLYESWLKVVFRSKQEEVLHSVMGCVYEVRR